MNFAASAGKAQDASGTPLKAVQIDGQVRASPGRGGFSRVAEKRNALKPRQDRASAAASSASPLEARRPGRRLLSPSSTSDSVTPDSSPSLTRW